MIQVAIDLNPMSLKSLIPHFLYACEGSSIMKSSQLISISISTIQSVSYYPLSVIYSISLEVFVIMHKGTNLIHSFTASLHKISHQSDENYSILDLCSSSMTIFLNL